RAAEIHDRARKTVAACRLVPSQIAMRHGQRPVILDSAAVTMFPYHIVAQGAVAHGHRAAVHNPGPRVIRAVARDGAAFDRGHAYVVNPSATVDRRVGAYGRIMERQRTPVEDTSRVE